MNKFIIPIPPIGVSVDVITNIVNKVSSMRMGTLSFDLNDPETRKLILNLYNGLNEYNNHIKLLTEDDDIPPIPGFQEFVYNILKGAK